MHQMIKRYQFSIIFEMNGARTAPTDGANILNEFIKRISTKVHKKSNINSLE